MQRIRNKVLDETGTNLMNEVIENYLRTGETDIAKPYASLMKEAAVSYVQEIFHLYIVVENPTYTLFACLLHLFVLLLFNLVIKVSDECWQF